MELDEVIWGRVKFEKKPVDSWVPPTVVIKQRGKASKRDQKGYPAECSVLRANGRKWSKEGGSNSQ